MECNTSLLASAVLVTLCIGVVVSDVHIYVSPTGSDQNDGRTVEHPVKTVDKAINLAWQVGQTLTVYIELMSGYHELTKKLEIGKNNVVVRSYQKQSVHLLGGRQLPHNAFKRVTDYNVLSRLPQAARNKVYVIHLPDLHITDYGQIKPYGSGIHRGAPLEVFFNGKPLTIAQWPNEGFINIVSVLDGQNGKRFQYNSNVPRNWSHEDDPWVYGYWYWSWSDRGIKVNSLNAQAMTVTLAEPALYGLRTGHWEDRHGGWSKQGGYFRFVNIWSALDQPGEFYVDKTHGDLYVWLPNNDGILKSSDRVYVSILDTCIQINHNIHNVVIEDFTLEACRGYGILGANSKNVQIKNMELRNIGGVSVFLSGDSRNNKITQCYIHDVDGGLYVTGGDRNTLETSGNIISNNDIFRYSRIGASGTDAIRVQGVGHLVQHNHVRNGQYTGIKFYGNDIIMEYNKIEYVCINTSDCGAFMTGMDWTTRGNIIRYNIVHDVQRRVPGNPNRAVMLDDQSSSTSIMYNVFYNNDVNVNIGGGRDNIVVNNVLYNAHSYNLEVGNRGVTHAFDNELFKRLHAVPYKSSVWALRYPELASIDSHNPSLPEGNMIQKNVIYTGPQSKLYSSPPGVIENLQFYNMTQNEFSQGRTDHYNVDIGDFRVTCSAASWANSVNFHQVPSPNDVGPTVPTGPTVLHRHLNHVTLSRGSNTCTTKPPSRSDPVPAWLPDGSRQNNIFHIGSKEGCWLKVDYCTNHSTTPVVYRDYYGETHEHAGDSEEKCFRRAAITWNYCGSNKNAQVAAIYAPTGATTIAGDGCFAAYYGCPNHGGPADGRKLSTGTLDRQAWVEQHANGAHNESACLAYALKQWVYCGSSRNHPWTFIYRPTGAYVTAGAGCWIHVQKCPSHSEYKSMFYDAWGATNYNTDDDESMCLHQSEYYWTVCGSDQRYPVTAYYRPTTARKTYP